MRVLQSTFTKTNPRKIFKPGSALSASVLDPPLLRPKEFYRAGTAPRDFEIPGSATECECEQFIEADANYR